MKKQRGFASIVALLIVGAVLIIGIQQWSMYKTKHRIIANSQSFYHRVLFLKTQFHAFANDQYLAGTNIASQYIFPFKLSDLEGDYIPTCTEADNQEGMCFRYNQTPWGEIAEEDYAVIPIPDVYAPTHYRAELTLKLPDKSDEALSFDRDVTLQLFAQMPNVIYDDTANTIILRIDRPDKAFAYESLVKRSGDDSTLLGDWDVGGEHAITNAKDYTIKNDDGTQQLVSRGLVNISQVEHGDFIDKPQCPTGQEPDLTLSIHTVTITNDYTLTGSIKPYRLSETATQWQAGLVIRAVKNSTGEPKKLHEGVMNAFIQCR
uniref:Type II secretion system protein n=1 Tax=Aliivibrio fischeri TaxID=668 RepID=A0A0H3ZNE2_ALIFS|nr:hypothetical protein [Aliivibrio fischeri]